MRFLVEYIAWKRRGMKRAVMVGMIMASAGLLRAQDFSAEEQVVIPAANQSLSLPDPQRATTPTPALIDAQNAASHPTGEDLDSEQTAALVLPRRAGSQN